MFIITFYNIFIVSAAKASMCQLSSLLTGFFIQSNPRRDSINV